MRLPVVVEAGLPIIVVISPRRIDFDWIEAQKREFERIYARDERYAIVTYSGFVETLPGAAERRALTDWTNEPRQIATQKRLCVGTATQLTSPLHRAFLQALFWMWSPPTEQAIYATLDESIDWCHQKLVAARVETDSLTTLRGRIHDAIGALHTQAKTG